jgi:hypothetical protein
MRGRWLQFVMITHKRKLMVGKIILVLCGLILLYAFANSCIADTLIKRNGNCMNGIIYRETLGGKTSPSFGYRFFVNSKAYEGLMTEDKMHKVGDSICVVYYVSYPKFNRPVSYFTSDKLKCSCK